MSMPMLPMPMTLLGRSVLIMPGLPPRVPHELPSVVTPCVRTLVAHLGGVGVVPPGLTVSLISWALPVPVVEGSPVAPAVPALLTLKQPGVPIIGLVLGLSLPVTRGAWNVGGSSVRLFTSTPPNTRASSASSLA